MPVAERADRAGDTEEVVLRVPADPAYLTVLRTATAGLAARLDMTLDEIEDLRIAVDEAAALLMGGGDEDAQLVAGFTIEPDALSVRVTGPATTLPEPHSFAWAVLEALAGEVETGSGDDGSWVLLRHERSLRDR
ncbi:MAG TPA: anti-sigma regulatory factor [Actinomycetales bacterium]|nr:anti-sigma regulatory factor [Actinomycetales bacterium]